MNATIKLTLRKDFKRKDGSNSIFLRLTINRKSRYYPIGISAQKGELQKDKFLFKNSIKDSVINNMKLNQAMAKAQQILNDFVKFEKTPTFIEFSLKFKSNYSSKDFYDFALSYIDTNKNLSKEAIRTYKSQITKLKKYHTSNISFSEVNNLDFIKAYENYMIDKLDNKTNTIYKSLAFIRTILNEAIKYSIIQDSVFSKIKLKKVAGNREFLRFSEINSLEKLLSSNKLSPKRSEVLRYFLFSCYTGLRFTDIKNLTYRDLFDYPFYNPETKETINRKMLTLEMHKTKRQVNIPLIPQARALMRCHNENNNSKVFNVLSNQKTNQNLKEIMKVAEIRKKGGVSFHCARHSFATNAIAANMSLPYVSQLLGHSETKTTGIYVKILKDVLFDETDKLANM